MLSPWEGLSRAILACPNSRSAGVRNLADARLLGKPIAAMMPHTTVYDDVKKNNMEQIIQQNTNQ